jgi:hypothetical protein
MIVVQVFVFADGALVAEGRAEGPGPETVDLFIHAVNEAQNVLIKHNTPENDDG